MTSALINSEFEVPESLALQSAIITRFARVLSFSEVLSSIELE